MPSSGIDNQSNSNKINSTFVCCVMSKAQKVGSFYFLACDDFDKLNLSVAKKRLYLGFLLFVFFLIIYIY